MTFESEKVSREFYAAIGADGLARRTRPEWDDLILADLTGLLSPMSRVLDLGCGYGRVAVPLAIAGHTVSGIDLSAVMIRTAVANAEAAGVSIPFAVGSMTALPYQAASFDAVLCLWSAFNELLNEAEQESALREMWRVLVPGGFALVEGALYSPPTDEEVAKYDRYGSGFRVRRDIIDGHPNPHYAHDRSSFEERCRNAGIASFHLEEREWGGRPRLVLTVRKI